MRGILLTIIAVVGLSACGTTPVKFSAAATTSQDRVFAWKNSGDGLSPVIVVRDRGFMGSGVYQALKVDGALVAKLDPGEAVTLYIPSGDHVFGVIPTPDILDAHTIQEVSVRIERGRTHYLRISIGPEGTSRIAPTAEVQ